MLKRIKRNNISTKITLDTFFVGGMKLEFYYCDDGKTWRIQKDVKNDPSVLEGFDGTPEWLNAKMGALDKYLTEEGYTNLIKSFLRSKVTQRWIMKRANGGYKTPRKATVAALQACYNKFKKKYTQCDI